MSNKQPVLLAVLVETDKRRWFVAAVTPDGQPVPLICSETGNLDAYVDAEFDEQVNFLRHRFSGVLQRGCDRLWGRQMKPRQIVFICDADFEPANPELTRRVADHFVMWMSNPPVTFFTSENGLSSGNTLSLNQLAGELDDADRTALATGLPQLISATANSDLWELSANKPAK